jgi:hypothetical protein
MFSSLTLQHICNIPGAVYVLRTPLPVKIDETIIDDDNKPV